VARLYADEDISPKIVRELRGRGHNVVSTVEQMRAQATDGDQLLYASQQGRIFLTHNKRDFFLLRDAWERWSGAWGARMAHASILALDRAHVQRLEKVVHDFLEATPELARGGYLLWWHQDTGVWDPLPRIP
jgi:hypothetical protein